MPSSAFISNSRHKQAEFDNFASAKLDAGARATAVPEGRGRQPEQSLRARQLTKCEVADRPTVAGCERLLPGYPIRAFTNRVRRSAPPNYVRAAPRLRRVDHPIRL